MKYDLQAAWRFIIETLFPAFCLGCRREGEFLCDFCLQTIPREAGTVEKPMGCFSLDGVISCASYEDGALLARAIHSFKYEFIKELAQPLGTFMAEAIPESFRGAVLCPVPLHRKRLRWRGFNQAELLAAVVAERKKISLRNLLERTSFKKPQMELSREERLMNVRQAFRLKEGISGLSHVILIDDVATTLATLEACATTLKDAGVPKVTAIVLARVY